MTVKSSEPLTPRARWINWLIERRAKKLAEAKTGLIKAELFEQLALEVQARKVRVDEIMWWEPSKQERMNHVR